MPRSKKPQASIFRAFAALVVIVAVLVGMRFGAFNWFGRLLVNFSIASMQQEVERQKTLNEKP